VLEVGSGDIVHVDCLCGQPDVLPSGSDYDNLSELRDAYGQVPRPIAGHLMTGPIAVHGAEAGDTLEVRILDIDLRQNWGYTRIRPLGGTLPEEFPSGFIAHTRINRSNRVGRTPWGMELPLRPFFGVLGVAPPPNWGMISSSVPREHGGNIDLKELTAGATLYLPVHNPGALFSIGDGHAIQGDGEVCSSALETSLSGSVALTVRKGQRLLYPRAETPDHHITLGFDPDLDDAARRALREMIALVCERSRLSREEAYVLCSLAGDLRITQLVNGHTGVHMMLAKTLVP
jgi:acetamidase/formamidase